MPAQMFNADLLACRNQDFTLQNAGVPNAAGVRVREQPPTIFGQAMFPLFPFSGSETVLLGRISYRV
jgi:hypothetical protein